MEHAAEVPNNWKDGVRVVRRGSLAEAMRSPVAKGRATAFDFTGSGGKETWIGTVTQPPGASTGAHHHGPHEVAVYVTRGCSQIRWGTRLEFGAVVEPGDFVYFSPFVPHQEATLGTEGPVEFVVVRSDNKGHVVRLDVVPVALPEMIF